MTIRRKTIRRLLLLAAVAGTSAAIVGAAFTVRRHARDAELAEARVTGMNAFREGDFARAMPALTTYVTARPDDVDAIYALACAHYNIETPGRDNLFDARSRLQQVLVRQPDHLLAKRQLLKIYERTRLSRELLAMADDVLKTVPGDVDATRCRAVAFTELERHAEALPAWEAYLALVPTDFRAQSQLLATMKRTGRSAEELVTYARATADKYPDDPRFQLPLAAALREAGRVGEAQSMLDALAAKPQTDPDFVVELAAALDRNRSFDVAERLLAKSADALKSSSLSVALVERMWQNGRHAEVISLTDGLLNAGGRRNPNVLALRALSLSAMGRREEANVLVKELGAIKGSEEAAGWADALSIEFDATPLAAGEQARRLRDALDHDPDNGILYAWLGRALRRSGEPEQSARCFREAAQRLPSWPTPCIELADGMLELNRVNDAAAAAKAAYLRAPSSAAVQILVARVRFAELRMKSTPDERTELLTRVEELARLLPADVSLATMRVALFAALERRSDAETAVTDALAALPRGTALDELYEAARAAGLASRTLIAERAEAENAITPSLAMSRALDLAAGPGDKANAITWIRSQATAHRGEPAWALAEVRTRQALGDPASAAAWVSIVGNFPNDLAIQSAALAEAADLIGDRAQQASIVERLKLIAGEDSSPYRIARARWLAASAEDGDLRQALSLTTDLVRSQPARADLRVLLARVLIRLDSSSTALDHLRTAHEQAPADASIALEYADALRRTGRWADGVAVLKAQAAYDIERAGPRIALAQALIDAGAAEQATGLLSRAAARGPVSLEERLLIAEARSAMNDVAGAASDYTAVAADPRATPAMLANVAAFERRQGRVDRATALLEQIDRSNASADDRARAAASYALEFGDADAARARFARELSGNSASAELMVDAIELEISQNNLAAASTLTSRAAEQFPGNARVKRVALEVAARRAAADGSADSAAIDALIASMASDPSSRREMATLRALRQSQATSRPTPELATRLAALSDTYPSSIELSRRAIETSFATGQPQIASAIARRLLASASSPADAVALASKSLLALGDLPAARRAAERWRGMAKDDPRDADVTLAKIALAENAPARALASVEPYRSAIDWNKDPVLPAVLTEALAKAGRASEAFEILAPALPSWSASRVAWLRIVNRETSPEAVLARLVKLQSATPADATEEQVRLGSAYLELAQSSGLPQAAVRGIALLTPVEASGRLVGNGRTLLAELQRAAGQRDQAQATLREALRAEPNNPLAKNSLAYLLLSTPGGADEAVALATDAVAASPGRAAFQDTLARAFVAAKQTAKAEASFREAIRLDADCLDAWIGLAGLQASQGKTLDAQASMRRVDAALSKAALQDAPPHLRAELRTVRESVATAHD